ncbi:MAG: PEP-CTERM sorting domain-containing protein [Azonexus sp.]|uniref:PEP-CTERM sorting domain-containing protein n=1 Tax=Azonexus sp. TaxID=1872668 RepID=UPI0028190C51|nr:PEP-CTERM sorting domain-containing protein [Azonexus sp.]MDR0776246.1 PEP-CTERM sorting domain-containing protein [Azonexus sp.]
MHKPSFTIKPMILSIGLLSLAASFTAQAAPVTYGNYTLDAEYIVGASSGPKQDGMSDSGAEAWSNLEVYAHPNGANHYSGRGNSLGSEVDFHTYGYDDSYYQHGVNFGAEVQGYGSFYALTSVNYSTEYKNTTDMAQNFILNFGVQEGELGIYGLGAGVADLLLSIRINGEEVALSKTTLTQDASGGRSCTSNGFGLLGDYMDCSAEYAKSIIAGPRSYTLDLEALGLDLIGAGEILTFDYEITATVYGDLSNWWGETGSTTYHSYTCDEWVPWHSGDVLPVGAKMLSQHDGVYCASGHYEVFDTNSETGYAIARSGDPLGNSWVPGDGPSAGFNGRFVDPNPSSSDVPEPSSVALFGLAIAGLAAIRRRRA